MGKPKSQKNYEELAKRANAALDDVARGLKAIIVWLESENLEPDAFLKEHVRKARTAYTDYYHWYWNEREKPNANG